MTDYTELVDALRMCQFGSGKCPECSYYGQKGNWPEDCDDKMHRDAADAIEALQAELPKRGEIVRCGECKYKPHWDEEVTENERDGFAIVFPVDYKCPCQCDDGWYSHIPDDKWFCANGEKMEVQE